MKGLIRGTGSVLEEDEKGVYEWGRDWKQVRKEETFSEKNQQKQLAVEGDGRVPASG